MPAHSVIVSANSRPVSVAASALPSMAATLTGWFRPLWLGRVTKIVVGGDVKETLVEQKCRGVIQPFGYTELKMKPEGQRSWKWQMLHTTPDVALKNDEEFRIRGVLYRVMGQKDYSDYGYITYDLVQDYTGIFQ